MSIRASGDGWAARSKARSVSMVTTLPLSIVARPLLQQPASPLWNGHGWQTHYAVLAGGRTVSDPDGTNLVQVLLGGADLRTVHPGVVMPSFGKGFLDAELAAASKYVIGRLGGQTGRVSPEQLRQDRSNQP
jgi:hypothetical protein